MTCKSIPQFAQRRNCLRMLAFVPLWLAGCTGPVSTEASRAREHRNIETDSDAALTRCYLASPAARQLVAQAAGVLVFPTVSLINPVTGEWAGMGALREGPLFTDYYFLSIAGHGMEKSTAPVSIILLFKSLGALGKFRLRSPWRAGGAANAAGMPDVLTLALRDNVLTTNPAMPEMVVVPLDT